MAAINKGWGKKLTGRLADYANASKGTLLLGDIQAHMIKEAAKPTTRRQDVVHPSEVAKTGWCPKATYLRIKAAREASDPFLKPPEKLAPQLLNIFDEGHYIHDKWQKRLRDMGDLWGNWECQNCGQFVINALYPPQCLQCDSTHFIYREVPMFIRDLLISGHADGAIPRLKSLIEIKSVGTGTVRIEAPGIFAANSDGQKIDLQGLWKDITEPFPAHLRQGQLYLWICAEMGLEFDKIIFLYESKFNQGAKEFVVHYNPSFVENIRKEIKWIAMALDGVMRNGEDCPICEHKNLNYPFICECTDDPIKCPYNGCKECDIYGSTSAAIRVGETTEPGTLTRSEGTRKTIRRGPGASKRIVRSS